MTTPTKSPKTAGPKKEFRNVRLSELRESKTNPRTVFDKKSLEDLAITIRKVGVLEPILTRSVNGHLEVVAGARRVRAAKLAKLPKVPVLVQDLTDVETLEIQVIENQQREDLHPLDEASGYRALMKEAGYDADTLGKKVGKSRSYVYQRLKLEELLPQLKKSLREKTISTGHAILIARLQEQDQKDVSKGLWQSTWDGNRQVQRLLSVRELSRWIQNNIHLDLHGAPFKKDEKDLVPKAGPCTTCPKRTGFAPALFPDIAKKDTCTDRGCFKEKLTAYLAKKIKELAAKDGKLARISTEYMRAPKGAIRATGWTTTGKKNCRNTRVGIFVDGKQVGQSVRVCTSTKCKTHYNVGPSPSYELREATRRKSQKETQRRQLTIRTRVLEQTLQKIPTRPESRELYAIARAYWKRHWNEIQVGVARRRGWIGKRRSEAEANGLRQIANMNHKELLQFLIELAVGPDVYDHWGTAQNLFPLARKYGVNPGRIETQVRNEIKEKKRKAKKRKKAKKSRRKATAKK